ncbi:MAG TPA: hypothetical protein VF242_10695 [Nitrososphaeraceae archaeon]
MRISVNRLSRDATGLLDWIAEDKALPSSIFLEGTGKQSRIRCISSYFGAN